MSYYDDDRYGFATYKAALHERQKQARRNGDTGHSDIVDNDGQVIGTVERTTRRTAAFDGLRLRSPRQDELDAMTDDELEQELSVYLCRLMC